MKRLLIAALLAGALSVPGAAALKTGAAAPIFKAKASKAGKPFEFSLAEALKKGPVVVYFYPAAFTGGCNIQAHSFAQNAAKFRAARTTIIGVSGDSIQKLNAFSADPQYCAGEFPVASDPDGAIGKSFDLKVTALDGSGKYKDSRGQALDHKVALERTTFVITPDRKIAAIYSTTEDKLKMTDHAERSLAFVQALAVRKR